MKMSAVEMDYPGSDRLEKANVSADFMNSAYRQAGDQLTTAQTTIEMGSAESVVDLAYAMKVDYERMINEIESLDRIFKWNLADIDSGKQESGIQQNFSSAGSQYDREFIQKVLNGHKQLISEFENQLQAGNLPVEIETWLETNLVMFNRHYATCQKIRNGAEVLP